MILDRPVEMLVAWVSGDHMLFVFRRGGGLVYGVDWSVDSPIGTQNPTDEELAQEIAFYLILEPPGPHRLDAAPADEIRWLGSSSVNHPRRLSDVRR